MSLKSKSNSRQIKVGVIVKILEKGLLLSVQFVISIILARLLMPDDYGLIAIITPFIAMPIIFFECGFCQSLVQSKNIRRKDIDTTFLCNIILALIIYAAIAIAAHPIAVFYNNLQIASLLRIYALSIIFASVSNIYNSILTRRLIFKKQMYASFVSVLVSGFIGIIMAYKGFGAFSLVFQYLSYRCLYTVGIMIYAKYIPRIAFSTEYFKSALKFSWKIIGSRVISSGANEIRNLIIGKYYTTETTGFFNKGQQLPSIISTAFDYSMQSVMFSAFSKSQSNIDDLCRMLRRTIRTTSFITFPLMFGMIATGTPLVAVIFSKKWLPIVPFIQICAIAYIFQPIQSSSYQALNALGLTHVTLRIEITKKIIELILILATVFINIYLLTSTFILSSIVGTTYYMMTVKRIINYRIKDQISDELVSLIPSILMFLCILPFDHVFSSSLLCVLTQTLLGGLAYIVFCFLVHNDSLHYVLRFISESFRK